MNPDALFSLNDKVALVTGGATGIGRMAAEGLLAAGAKVYIASRKEDACQAVATELNAIGLKGSIEGNSSDVGTEENQKANFKKKRLTKKNKINKKK